MIFATLGSGQLLGIGGLSKVGCGLLRLVAFYSNSRLIYVREREGRL